MSEKDLEKTMIDFYQKRSNVLVCTTIIESGLDVPSANTIIINRADLFGLAQLYQLRGRVGRSGQRAYCYLLVSSTGKMTDDARKRLEVIQRFVELGSGFSIASHDLEIRGGGNLLGAEQSGHIAAVGFDMYTELLEEAVEELRGRPSSSKENLTEPEIKTPYASFLDEHYISDVHHRLNMYRRLSSATDDQELQEIESELVDRFGRPPHETQNLIWIIRLKQLLRKHGIGALTVGKGKAALVPTEYSAIDPSKVVPLLQSGEFKVKLTPDSRLILTTDTQSVQTLFFTLEKLFHRISSKN